MEFLELNNKSTRGTTGMNQSHDIISLVADRQDLDQFRKKTWEGSFQDYLDLVRVNPMVTRNAFQRVYDMIMSYGTDGYQDARGEKRVHYRFFDDPDDDGRDAVFGLNGPLESLVHALKSAAQGYGIEKRVLLLHGPVGSSKSTIARLMKKGLERYSDTRRRSTLYAGLGRSGVGRRSLVPDERRAAAPHPGTLS